MFGDIAGLGVTLGAMGGVMNLTRDALNPIMNNSTQLGADFGAVVAGQVPADTWNCACGEKNITRKFCPECGAKKPEPVIGWNCACGEQNITRNFCPECGAKKPEPVVGWDCSCGEKNILRNFCPECGAKKPEPVVGWDCSCGEKEITRNFCPNCGNKRLESKKENGEQND